MHIVCTNINGIRHYTYTHSNGSVYSFQLKPNGNSWDAYINDQLIISNNENRTIARENIKKYIFENL